MSLSALLEVIEPLQHDGNIDVEQVRVMFAVPDGVAFQCRLGRCEPVGQFLLVVAADALVDDPAGLDVLEEEPDLSAVGVQRDRGGFADTDFGHGKDLKLFKAAVRPFISVSTSP